MGGAGLLSSTWLIILNVGTLGHILVTGALGAGFQRLTVSHWSWNRMPVTVLRLMRFLVLARTVLSLSLSWVRAVKRH